MFKYKAHKQKCVASIEGEMTIYSAAELKEKLAEYLDDARTLELDLRKVTEIDSAGVQLLILAKKSRADNDQNTALAAPSKTVIDTLEAIGLMPYFDQSVAASKT